MVKVKTSIYIDRELWEKFKKHALTKDMEVSALLEDLMRDEMIEETIDEILVSVVGLEGQEVDFEPIEPKQGLVSELVRAVRDERGRRISG
ncbi:hypothetical protein HRbin02_01617 [Candidatus Calditenuaceae archaeon HR02]|nr:hypothetical protein HRbin02_01617 [Candidatus Calditenuaceae archaeon HR02]